MIDVQCPESDSSEENVVRGNAWKIDSHFRRIRLPKLGQTPYTKTASSESRATVEFSRTTEVVSLVCSVPRTTSSQKVIGAVDSRQAGHQVYRRLGSGGVCLHKQFSQTGILIEFLTGGKRFPISKRFPGLPDGGRAMYHCQVFVRDGRLLVSESARSRMNCATRVCQ